MSAPAIFGEIIFTRHYDPAADPAIWVTIDHADPRILISHQLLEQIARGRCDPWDPWAVLDKTCACSPEVRKLCMHYQGARLELTASNTRLVYVIGEPRYTSWCWEAEWPD